MPVDFEKLLASQRLRPLWAKEAPADKPVPAAAEARVDDRQEAAGSHLATEADTPAAVLQALETSIAAHAGAGSALLVHILAPLRAGISRLDPTAAPLPAHPLQRASAAATGGPNVPNMLNLIDQLDDILSALLPKPR
jgi:hypothetical protein